MDRHSATLDSQTYASRERFRTPTDAQASTSSVSATPRRQTQSSPPSGASARSRGTPGSGSTAPWVDVTHSLFDIGEIKSAFDGDSHTLVRTFEANPAVVRLMFPRGR